MLVAPHSVHARRLLESNRGVRLVGGDRIHALVQVCLVVPGASPVITLVAQLSLVVDAIAVGRLSRLRLEQLLLLLDGPIFSSYTPLRHEADHVRLLSRRGSLVLRDLALELLDALELLLLLLK